MKKSGAILIVLLLALVWAKQCFYSSDNDQTVIDKEEISGKVIKIADGDTFTLLDDSNQKQRIRLHGIDCPERQQAYSKKASQFLADQIKGKFVQVKIMDIDRYGRIIGMVFYNNKNINESLLAKGLAWHYKKYDNNTRWAKIEAEAKAKQLGLWADDNVVAPWAFRAAERAN